MLYNYSGPSILRPPMDQENVILIAGGLKIKVINTKNCPLGSNQVVL